MSKMNGKGPEGKGSKTGRGLGKCSDVPKKELLQRLGKGMGQRRKSGGGEGEGRRLKYSVVPHADEKPNG